MTRFQNLWVTKAWLASAFYSALYLLISFCTFNCTFLSHWGFLTNAIYKVQTLHVKWCVNVMACWCHCLKQLPFSLGWLNSPRCWLAPLCKVGRPTRRLGDKERALPCRDVPLTSHRELPSPFGLLMLATQDASASFHYYGEAAIEPITFTWIFPLDFLI